MRNQYKVLIEKYNSITESYISTYNSSDITRTSLFFDTIDKFLNCKTPEEAIEVIKNVDYDLKEIFAVNDLSLVNAAFLKLEPLKPYKEYDNSDLVSDLKNVIESIAFFIHNEKQHNKNQNKYTLKNYNLGLKYVLNNWNRWWRRYSRDILAPKALQKGSEEAGFDLDV